MDLPIRSCSRLTNSAKVSPNKGLTSGDVQEVTSLLGAKRVSPKEAVRVVEGDLHEALERHWAVGFDLMDDAIFDRHRIAWVI